MRRWVGAAQPAARAGWLDPLVGLGRSADASGASPERWLAPPLAAQAYLDESRQAIGQAC